MIGANITAANSINIIALTVLVLFKDDHPLGGIINRIHFPFPPALSQPPVSLIGSALLT